MGEETHRVCCACFPLGLENGDVDVAQQFPLAVQNATSSNKADHSVRRERGRGDGLDGGAARERERRKKLAQGVSRGLSYSASHGLPKGHAERREAVLKDSRDVREIAFVGHLYRA